MPKKYAEGFERETVRLARTSGRSQSSICGNLGVSRTTLMRWLSKHGEGEGAASGEKTLRRASIAMLSRAMETQ